MFNRNLYVEKYSGQFPSFPCSICESVSVEIVNYEKDIIFHQTQDSKSEAKEVYWEPDMTRAVFNAQFKCTKCKNNYFMAGKGEISAHQYYTQSGEPEWDWDVTQIYIPMYVYPTISILTPNANIPHEIASNIEVANSLFWPSPSACGNSLRTTVECLLDSLDIPKFNKNDRKLSLHVNEHLKLSHYWHLKLSHLICIIMPIMH
ncbi:MAG: hypothetical protein COB24_05905 [Hyphomicrobiales bacterium]|nr:MAG: hypothetical protein COB24_05905 [Hyphomicrobiales bacterium]